PQISVMSATVTSGSGASSMSLPATPIADNDFHKSASNPPSTSTARTRLGGQAFVNSSRTTRQRSRCSEDNERSTAQLSFRPASLVDRVAWQLVKVRVVSTLVVM